MAGPPLLPHAHRTSSTLPPRPDVLARPFDPDRDAEEVWHLVQGAYAGVEGHLPAVPGELARQRASRRRAGTPAFWLLSARFALGYRRRRPSGERGGKGETRTGIITVAVAVSRAGTRPRLTRWCKLLLGEFRTGRVRHAEASVTRTDRRGGARLFEPVAGMRVARENGAVGRRSWVPDLAEIAARARETGRLGIDTEFMAEGRYRPLLCLVEVAVDGRSACSTRSPGAGRHRPARGGARGPAG